MTHTVTFKMRILDIFRFADGRTVFVGFIEEGPPFLRATACQLVVDGVVRQSIQLEGEMLPSPPPENGRRTVSTRDTVQLSPSEIESSMCVLEKRVKECTDGTGSRSGVT